MKFLIFSDSHGQPKNIEKAMQMHHAEIPGMLDGIIFAGDGLYDFNLAHDNNCPDVPAYCVRGNCDFFNYDAYPWERTINLGQIKIYLTHGHKFDSSGDLLIKTALEKGANIVISGHTHVRESVYLPDDRIYIFNPGSISCPRDALPQSFGVLETRRDQWLLSHGQI